MTNSAVPTGLAEKRTAITRGANVTLQLHLLELGRNFFLVKPENSKQPGLDGEMQLRRHILGVPHFLYLAGYPWNTSAGHEIISANDSFGLTHS